MSKVKDYIKNIDKNYYFIFLISIIILGVFFSNKYVIGHDTLYHISNIEILKNMISSLNFSKIVKFSAINLGYGSSLFYPRFPQYLTAIIYWCINKVGGGLIASIKVGHFITVYFSGFYMYKLLKYIFKQEKLALIGSIIYLTMPYFISDIFIRDAYNESFVFIFMPMITLGILNLINKDYKNFYFNFTIGYILLINSHLVLGIFFTMFLCIFLLFKTKFILNKEIIKKLIVSSLVIIVICLPELTILLQHKLTNLYTVFNPEIMGSTSEHLRYYSVSLKEFIFPIGNSKTNIFGFINIAVLILIIIELISFIKRLFNKTKIDSTETGILFLTFLSFLMCFKFFPFEIFPKLLLSVQFAFRFITFLCFFITILAMYGLKQFKKNFQTTILAMILPICLVTYFFTVSKVELVNSSEIKYDIFYNSMGWQKEYLPQNLNRNFNYLKGRKSEVLIISGNENVNINILEENMPYMKFVVSNVSSPVELELPRIFYLGYQIKVVDQTKSIKKIKYSCSKNGFIKISLDKDSEVIVKYKGTAIYNVFRILRIWSLLFIFTILIYKLIKKSNNNFKGVTV